MKITGNPFINSTLKNAGLPTLKKEEPISETERYIDDMKRITKENEQANKRMEAEQIAKRIARGEYVTQAERDQVSGIDAEILKKAEQANLERKQLQARLANAATKEEARALMLQGKLSAGETMEKYDEKYGELLIEAINQAEENHFGNRQKKPEESVLTNLSGIDIRL